MRQGFVLLEIIIALALGALILSALWMTFFQVNTAYKMADRWIDFDMRAAVVQHQFERDLSGAFVPMILIKKEKAISEKKSSFAKQSEKKASEKKETKKEDRALENSFISKNKDGNLQFITCVTSNPLQIYGNKKPRVARVTYSLVPEKSSDKKTYQLIRQETQSLPFVEPREGLVKGQELAAGIQSLTVDVGVRLIEENKKKTTDGEKKSPKLEIFKTWGKEQIKKSKKQTPDFVTMTISFWDKQKKRSQRFVFRSDIVVSSVFEEFDEDKSKTEDQSKKNSQNKSKTAVGVEVRLESSGGSRPAGIRGR